MSDFSFPLGIAKNTYFCNRVDETAKLINNISHQTHTVLIAPRRYGKTSLAYRAIKKSGDIHAIIDLFMAGNKPDIEQAILKGVNDVIAQVSGITEKWLKSLTSIAKSLKPILSFGAEGITLSLEPMHSTSQQNTISESLQILDAILDKKQQRCVLLIDEFQEIEVVAPNQGIEGAIRHAAQDTDHIAIIFSGSNRSLLKSMFNDRNKPLYRLCDEMKLERIAENDYHKFVNEFAIKQWGRELPEESFTQIITLTERHPYYFNALLSLIFQKQHQPQPNTITQLWEEFAAKKKSDLMAEVKTLSLIDKKILVAIANGFNSELTGKSFLGRFGLASSSVTRSVEQLINNDFIEKISDHYRLIDPLLKTIILLLRKI